MKMRGILSVTPLPVRNWTDLNSPCKSKSQPNEEIINAYIRSIRQPSHEAKRNEISEKRTMRNQSCSDWTKRWSINLFPWHCSLHLAAKRLRDSVKSSEQSSVWSIHHHWHAYEEFLHIAVLWLVNIWLVLNVHLRISSVYCRKETTTFPFYKHLKNHTTSVHAGIALAPALNSKNRNRNEI